MGVIGILPLIADTYNVTISTAGMLVSLFALAVAIAGPTMPLLCSAINRKTIMVVVLGIFTICNIISAFSSNFTIVLIARVLPAFFHPVYVAMAFSVAATSVPALKAPEAASKVMMGVSAGMVLGVPIISAIATATSLEMAMLAFAVVNAIALVASIIFIPTIPVTERLSYGSQLNILKSPVVWLSIIGVMLLNGGIFGVYSYIAEYLTHVTMMPAHIISILLFVYGLANILGNAIAGKMLTSSPIKLVTSFPVALCVIYIVLQFSGHLTIMASALILLWGILAGIGANINQYWIVSAAPKAPDFANGLFLAATNLGTTIGATLCGYCISQVGTSSIPYGGILLLLLSEGLIIWRVNKTSSAVVEDIS